MNNRTPERLTEDERIAVLDAVPDWIRLVDTIESIITVRLENVRALANEWDYHDTNRPYAHQLRAQLDAERAAP